MFDVLVVILDGLSGHDRYRRGDQARAAETRAQAEEASRPRSPGRDDHRVEHCVVRAFASVAAGRAAAAQAPGVERGGELRIDPVGHAALFGLSARRSDSSARCCSDFTAPTVRFVVEATSSSD